MRLFLNTKIMLGHSLGFDVYDQRPFSQTVKFRHKMDCLDPYGNVDWFTLYQPISYGIRPPLIKMYDLDTNDVSHVGQYLQLCRWTQKTSNSKYNYYYKDPNTTHLAGKDFLPGAGIKSVVGNLDNPFPESIETLMKWLIDLVNFHGWDIAVPQFYYYDIDDLNTPIPFTPKSVVDGFISTDTTLHGQPWIYTNITWQIVDFLSKVAKYLGIPYWEDLWSFDHNYMYFQRGFPYSWNMKYYDLYYTKKQNADRSPVIDPDGSQGLAFDIKPYQLWQPYTKEVLTENIRYGKFSVKDFYVLFPDIPNPVQPLGNYTSDINPYVSFVTLSGAVDLPPYCFNVIKTYSHSDYHNSFTVIGDMLGTCTPSYTGGPLSYGDDHWNGTSSLSTTLVGDSAPFITKSGNIESYFFSSHVGSGTGSIICAFPQEQVYIGLYLINKQSFLKRFGIKFDGYGQGVIDQQIAFTEYSSMSAAGYIGSNVIGSGSGVYLVTKYYIGFTNDISSFYKCTLDNAGYNKIKGILQSGTLVATFPDGYALRQPTQSWGLYGIPTTSPFTKRYTQDFSAMFANSDNICMFYGAVSEINPGGLGFDFGPVPPFVLPPLDQRPFYGYGNTLTQMDISFNRVAQTEPQQFLNFMPFTCQIKNQAYRPQQALVRGVP